MPAIARHEGLQIRWLHEPDFDMVEEFLFILDQFGIRPPELLDRAAPGWRTPERVTAG